MSASLSSEEFLALSLLLVDGNTKAPLEEVIRRAEAYQRASKRRIGASRNDFRGALYALAVIQAISPDHIKQVFAMTTLSLWIDTILRHREVHFERDRCSWSVEIEQPPSERNSKIRQFLEDGRNHLPKGVLRFLDQQGLGRDLLISCSTGPSTDSSSLPHRQVSMEGEDDLEFEV